MLPFFSLGIPQAGSGVFAFLSIPIRVVISHLFRNFIFKLRCDAGDLVLQLLFG